MRTAGNRDRVAAVRIQRGRSLASNLQRRRAPGGAWIGPAILQVLLNVLDFGMGMQEAISAPRFAATTDAIDISNRIPLMVQRELEAKGYEVRRSALTFPFAAPHGITMWDGVLEGGADPQRDGYVAGVA